MVWNKLERKGNISKWNLSIASQAQVLERLSYHQCHCQPQDIRTSIFQNHDDEDVIEDIKYNIDGNKEGCLRTDIVIEGVESCITQDSINEVPRHLHDGQIACICGGYCQWNGYQELKILESWKEGDCQT
jgi:hypothetical protein